MIALGKFRRFWANRAGGFALQAAVFAPFLLGTSAAVIDFMAFTKHRASLQAAADHAAIASVREAALDGWSEKRALSVARSVISSNYSNALSPGATYKINAQPDKANRRVTVNITQDHHPYFAARFFPSPQIAVEATATASTSQNICVVGLDTNKKDTMLMATSAKLTAKGCSVYSNSKHKNGISILDSAKVEANLVCSAGGINSNSGNIVGQRVSNCPSVSDPLIARPEPAIGGCDFNKRKVTDVKTTLSPGVYCGGLTINGTANVTLNAGVYIIKDGAFLVGDNAKVTGRGVGMYFAGKKSYLEFTSNAAVDLEAPETGDMAGILFFASRGAVPERKYRITSNYTSNLVGTVYLPQGILMVDANTPVAESSAYTAIVVHRLELDSSPNLVLNTDYSNTSVPVPDGIGNVTSVKLIE